MPDAAPEPQAASREDRLIESFVPPMLRASWPDDAPQRPMALLWLDIVGSTALMARLTQADPAGTMSPAGVPDVEHFAALLDRHFDRILSVVTAHGGVPMMFAGDALLCGWESAPGDAATATTRAAACARDLLAQSGSDGAADILPLHLAVAFGPCGTTRLGAGAQSLFVTLGAGLKDLQAATAHRAPGQILLSAAARAALGPEAAVTRLSETGFILDQLTAPAPRPVAMPSLPEAALAQAAALAPLPVASRLAPSLLPSMAPSVAPTLDSSRGLAPLDRRQLASRALAWAAELRRVTVLFVGFTELDHAGPDILAQLRQIAEIAAPLVRRHGGYLHQLRVDESGANLLINFGIPPIAHADDPARATACALDLQVALRAIGRRAGFGVATGRLLCGLIGNDVFRGFCVYGAAVNLAARLRQLRLGQIQCDDATMRAARDALDFTQAGQTRLRGTEQLVNFWTPTPRDRPRESVPMQGRAAELAILTAALAQAGAGQPRVVVIEAESGMGKSRLLAEFQLHAAAHGTRILTGAADRIEQSVPYRAWAGVVAGLLDLTDADPARARLDLIAAIGPDLAPQAAVLNAVLPFDLPETGLTLGLAPMQRVPLLRQLLLTLLRRAAAAGRLLVTIDDAHWMDEESWTLAREAADLPGLCLVLSLQPLENDGHLRALAASGARLLRLAEIGDADQDRLALSRLGAARLEPEVAAVLRGRTHGHPFFCMELAAALRDEGVIEIADGICRFARDVDAARLQLPDTVQATVTRRIDRLAPESQTTLKVASAIGLRFPEALVAAVHPIAAAAPQKIASHLASHHRLGLILPEVVDELDGYAFRHGIMRDVAYGRMLYGQRRQLHHDIAAWYEAAGPQYASRLYTVLAHHWEAAGDTTRAAEYQRLESERLFSLGLVRQAVAAGRYAAVLLGAALPEGDSPAAFGQEIGRELTLIATLLGDRRPEDLPGLPPLADPRVEQLIASLLSLAPFAHQMHMVELFVLASCQCLRLTLEHGNGALAPDVYAMYSIINGALTGNRPAAAPWSRLGLAMLDKASQAGFARCAFIHAWFHNHWVAPLEDGLALALRGAEAGLASGEVLYGCFNLSAYVVLLAASGARLGDVAAASRAHAIRNGKRILNSHFHLVFELQYAKALAGETAGPLVLGDAEYNEDADIAAVVETGLSNQIGYYYVTRLRLHVLAGDHAGARHWAGLALPLLASFSGQTAEFELTQYRGIAALALAAGEAGDARGALLDEGEACLAQLRFWQAGNPGLFTHKADLLEGLRHAAAGAPQAAVAALRRAADGAGGFLQDAALAHEWRARLGGDRAAAVQAVGCYAAWGAAGKARTVAAEFGV